MSQRSRRLVTLGAALVVAGLLLWWLNGGGREVRTEPTPIERALGELERELARAPGDPLARALYALRGLGPKAPASAREQLRAALAQRDELGPLPSWVGLEPRRALAAVLLESRDPTVPLVEAPGAADAKPPSPDLFTLYWQLEHASLLRRMDAALVPAEKLARLCNGALRHLERESLESLDAAWLAAAIFRAVPTLPDPELEARARRLYAKLGAASRSPGAPVELAAARLEALSSHALWQLAGQGRLDPKTRALLLELQSALRLSLGSKPEGPAATAAALRALRLSKAVLGDTDGVFPQ